MLVLAGFVYITPHSPVKNDREHYQKRWSQEWRCGYSSCLYNTVSSENNHYDCSLKPCLVTIQFQVMWIPNYRNSKFQGLSIIRTIFSGPTIKSNGYSWVPHLSHLHNNQAFQRNKTWLSINPFSPAIIIQILLTGLHTFHWVLFRRTSLKLKTIHLLWWFP